MISAAQFIARLTIRLELYTNVIVVPLVFYFGVITRNHTEAEQHIMNIASLFASTVMLVIGTMVRTIILTITISKIKREKGDMTAMKVRLLNYPRIELIIISCRWVIGLLFVFMAMKMTVGLTLQQSFTFILLVITSTTVNAVISYFATENKLSSILALPRLAALPVPPRSYARIGITFRLIMTVVAVLIIPIIFMGYMLWLINQGVITRFEQFYIHISVILVMTLITLATIIFESTRGIRRGMAMTIETIKDLSQGKFNRDNLPMLDRSEIGSISLYLNVLADSLREFDTKRSELNTGLATLTVKLSENAESLTANTREQASSMEEIMATTEEVSSGAESVMASVDNQFEALGSLIASMKSLSEVMAMVTAKTESVARLSRDIEEKATSGGATLTAMIDSLKIVSESSRQMTGITEIINDISDKINLLSLNASIEAARAGDAGRGFAVVAEEISKLADMTANSIKDINALVKRNIEEIQTGMTNVDNAVDTIGGITGLVNTIKTETDGVSAHVRSQHEINTEVNREVDLLKEKSEIVKTAMQEQKNAMGEITRAITNISQFTQGTVQAAERLFIEAKEVDKMAGGLVD